MALTNFAVGDYVIMNGPPIWMFLRCTEMTFKPRKPRSNARRRPRPIWTGCYADSNCSTRVWISSRVLLKPKPPFPINVVNKNYLVSSATKLIGRHWDSKEQMDDEILNFIADHPACFIRN